MRFRTLVAGSVAFLSAVNCSDDTENRDELIGGVSGAGAGASSRSSSSRAASIGGAVVVGASSAAKLATGGAAGANVEGEGNHVGMTGSASENLAGGAGISMGNASFSLGSGGTVNGTTAAFAGGAISVATGGNGTTVVSLCGDGRCDTGESSTSCCADCGCTSAGSVCHRGICATPVAIAAGGFHACVLLGNGTVECWGGNSFGEVGNGAIAVSVVSPTTVSGLTRGKAIAAGASFTCALIDDGTVKCWGDNASGQLGDNTTNSSAIPVTVYGLTNAIAIAAGFDSACAVLASGAVQCWGNNSSGQLGNGTTISSSVPVAVASIGDAVRVTVGYNSACVTVKDGTAHCWGSNKTGQLGDGSNADSLTPVTVGFLASVTLISATCNEIPNSVLSSWGDGSVCALLQNGTAKCWGSNEFGELGKGNVSPSSLRPVPVVDLANATAIAAGNKFACAVGQAGTVGCWGSNGRGQLGNGTDKNSPVPVPVSNLSNVTQVAAGAWHACALLSTGTIKCWGNNMRNELGNNDAQMSLVPVTVPAWSAGPDSGGGGAGNTPGAGGAAGSNALGGGGMGGASSSTASSGGTIATGGASGEGNVLAGAAGVAGGMSTAVPEPCSVPGATECKGRRAVRTCTDGQWVESPCSPFQACAAGACREGCPELTVPADTEVACYMPVDPFGDYHGAPLTAMPLVSDAAALPAWVISGVAYDTHDTGTYSDDTAAPVVPDPLGLIWRADLTPKTVGRLYLSAYIDMPTYASKFGAPPVSMAIHIKMRRIADASRSVPWPAFALVDGEGAYITYWEDDSAFMTPTTEWAVYSRAFTAKELSGLQLDSDSNWFELDFGGDAARSIPPQNVEVAWFAVTYDSPS